MLAHRRRGVTAHVADGDGERLGRFQVDVVGAGGGDANELQAGYRAQGLFIEHDLITDDHARAVDALDGVVLEGVVVRLPLRKHRNERSEIDIAAGIDGVTVEQDATLQFVGACHRCEFSMLSARQDISWLAGARRHAPRPLG